jgi:hypothetical protein
MTLWKITNFFKNFVDLLRELRFCCFETYKILNKERNIEKDNKFKLRRMQLPCVVSGAIRNRGLVL